MKNCKQTYSKFANTRFSDMKPLLDIAKHMFDFKLNRVSGIKAVVRYINHASINN